MTEANPTSILALGPIAYELGLMAFGVVMALLVYCSIFAKAGYSKWWGLLGLVPYLGLFFPIFFALTNWPVQRELACLRVRAGVGKEADAYEVLHQAGRLQRKGRAAEGIELYQLVEQRFSQTPVGNDARIALQQAQAGA